jgi:hypothetical protein
VITDADGLLAARFGATRDDYDDADWNDVLRRRHPRRNNHRRALFVAVAVIVVGVPTAIAFGGVIRSFFFGTPAPPIIKGAFSEHNEMQRMMTQWQKAHGLHFPAMPQVDVAKAHGVIAVKTRDGLLFLWAAPAADGRQCWFVDFAADQINHKHAIGGGSCDRTSPPPSKITWGTEGSVVHPKLTVFSGRVYVPATAVVATTGRTKRRVMVVDRYFLAAFPRGAKTPTMVIAVDAHGRVVARSAP